MVVPVFRAHTGARRRPVAEMPLSGAPAGNADQPNDW